MREVVVFHGARAEQQVDGLHGRPAQSCRCLGLGKLNSSARSGSARAGGRVETGVKRVLAMPVAGVVQQRLRDPPLPQSRSSRGRDDMRGWQQTQGALWLWLSLAS